MIPRATYRFQFHKGFPFAAAGRLAPYLDRLGISHVYASPVLTARAGSTHGYDVVDPTGINPELGGEDGFRAMAAALRAHGIGIVADIVPNHMAVGGGDNAWWLDVLEKGPDSPYAPYFDIDWKAPGLKGKILAPFLGVSLDKALKSGDLTLRREAGKLAFAYYDHRFPLRPEDQETYKDIDPSALSPEDLHDRQHFILTDWREADRRINWRRFFDITSLAALDMSRDEVFEAAHGKILALYAEGLLDGLRIDHVDGLGDPRAYCRKLRARLQRLRPDWAYIVVEKILASDEILPSDWEVEGTTGYDFMNEVSAVLHGTDPGHILDRLWSRYGLRTTDFEVEERQARAEILATKFESQVNATARAFKEVCEAKISVPDLSAAICEMRCYRSYATGHADSPGPGALPSEAVARAEKVRPGAGVVGGILRATTGKPKIVEAVQRFNQLTAPVAAKAVEDTAFYRHGRLLSRNDVGFDPRQRCMEVETFHRLMVRRAESFPASMLTTATHDHKRGEDARARLAVLSEVSDSWAERVEGWFASNAPSGLQGGDEYQLYQSLLGSWPRGGTANPEFAALPDRIEGWCLKYLREAKLRSSWQSPDTSYEAAFRGFARSLLADAEGRQFRSGMDDFVTWIDPAAEANSLVQCALRFTVPGVPDLYQGCEFWDFSLVDPDNRRPVDFRSREKFDGRHMKQSLIRRLLQLRRQHPDLFQIGGYRAVEASGPRRENVIAFERRLGDKRLWVAALRRGASALCGTALAAPAAEWWGETALDLPRDIFGDRRAADLLRDFPLSAAVLVEGTLSFLPPGR